jgi:hypothetical protein
MGGTAIVWVMAPFSSTDFDENIFFGLNKEPNFQNPVYSHESGIIFDFSHTFNIRLFQIIRQYNILPLF